MGKIGFIHQFLKIIKKLLKMLLEKIFLVWGLIQEKNAFLYNKTKKQIEQISEDVLILINKKNSHNM